METNGRRRREGEPCDGAKRKERGMLRRGMRDSEIIAGRHMQLLRLSALRHQSASSLALAQLVS
jgi:hypothetical protein